MIHGVDPGTHLRECQELIAQGYRPASWSASRGTAGVPVVTASVWHRPVIMDDTRDRLAERQAHAAIALVRLGRPGEIMPLVATRRGPPGS